ncbi:T9SS type A sorting domain-containing protein [Aquimarina hainanensis]|uniref:T9SS type A sorting domain-containing protein n=1 Tax=Aquimarina hainanensis TaxID=1578017 RepID=A0ABW5ND83_9FLAO
MMRNYLITCGIWICTIFSVFGQQIDISDKNVLLKFYEATNGANWHMTWDLSGDAVNWYGITLNGEGKVTEISLSYNNLEGSIPTELAMLDQLEKVSLHNNKLKGGLPDLNALTVLDVFRISDNYYRFEDLEATFDDLSIRLSDYRYAPQQSPIGKENIAQLIAGEKKVFEIYSDATSNMYQWRKNGVNIDGAIQKKYTIDAMSMAEEGVYDCVITNSKIGELELVTNGIAVVLSKNLIKNASFEDWFDIFGSRRLSKWYAGIDVNNTLTNITEVADAIQGIVAVKMQTNRIDGGGNNFGELSVDTNHRFRLESGKRYQISYDYKIVSGNFTKITTKCLEGGLLENQEDKTILSGQGWQSHSYNFTADRTSDAYDFKITVYGDTADSEILLDNFYIVEEENIQTTPTSLSEFYTFSSGTETYVPITDPDEEYTPVEYSYSGSYIPFDFLYAGQKRSYMYYSENTNIAFGSTLGVITNDLSFFRKEMIAPLKDEMNIGVDTRILLKTRGVAPNRVYVVEWKNAYWSDDKVNGAVNIQLHLEEGTNNIKFVYGPGTASTAQKAASIGMTTVFGETPSFMSVTPGNPATVSTTTSYHQINREQFPNEGTAYTFTYIGVPQCQQPTEIQVDERESDTEMRLSWYTKGFSGKHTLYVKKAFSTDSPMSYITNKGEYIVTGLSADTGYEAWVINNCSPEQSSVRSPVKYFRTPPLCRGPSDHTDSQVQKNSISLSWEGKGNESQWDVVILPRGQDLGGESEEEDLPIITIATPSYTFENLEEDTEFYIYYRANCGEGEVSLWNSGFFRTTSDCARPRELQSIVTTATTATVSWTPIGSETSWEIVVQKEGAEPTGGGVIVSSPEYEVIGVDNTSIYEYYVRAICSETEKSAWSRKVITEELQSERELLIAFYEATNGPNWNYKDRWNTDSPISTWEGVSVVDGRVNELNLSRNNLKGTLPEALFELTALSSISLSNNQLTGEIPTTINRLIDLKQLVMNNNHFSGSIPEELGELLGLEGMYLEGNQFEGLFPVSIGNLKNLKALGLQSMNAETVPSSYANLTKLQILNISGSNLNTFPSFVKQMKRLYFLELDDNELEGAFPEELLSLPKLRFLNLSSNHFSGVLPEAITQLDLWNLDIRRNTFSGSIPEQLGQLENLYSFDMRDNQYDFETLETFQKTTPLITSWEYVPQSFSIEELKIEKFIGEMLSITTQVGGENNLYQWYKDGVSIEGATTKTLEKNNISLEESGIYYCTVSNSLITGFSIQKERFIVQVQIVDTDQDGVNDAIDQCLDTPAGALVDVHGCTIVTIPDDYVTIQIIDASCRGGETGKVLMNTAHSNYEITATLTAEGVYKTTTLSTSGEIKGLMAGTYNLCLTMEEAPSFEQCYTVTINEPETLAVFATTDFKSSKTVLNLSGANTYYIDINGLQFSTNESLMPIVLDQKKNVIKVTTDLSCQGTYQKIIYLQDTVTTYPNPFTDDVYLSIPYEKGRAMVSLYTLTGQEVYTSSYTLSSEDIRIDTNRLPIGNYMVKVTTATAQYNVKIVKK